MQYADLTALGIPHPKRSNVSVVYPGTVRFFWIALPHAVRGMLSLLPGAWGPHSKPQR
jgi:hypothetical protein